MSAELPRPAEVNFRWRRGCGVKMLLTLKASKDQPFDITGYTWSAAAKFNDASSSVVHATVTPNVDPTTGKVTVNFAASSTIPSSATSAVWDLIGTPGGSDPVPFIEGTIQPYSGAA